MHDVAIVGAGLAGSAAAALYGRRGLDVVLLERDAPTGRVQDRLHDVLDGSGHWPMLDDPERVAGVAVPFLRRRLP